MQPPASLAAPPAGNVASADGGAEPALRADSSTIRGVEYSGTASSTGSGTGSMAIAGWLRHVAMESNAVDWKRPGDRTRGAFT